MNTAPLELYTDRVRPEWIDENGHMNVAYYMLSFDGATDAFLDYLGLGTQYTEATGGSTFTAEAHISYLREVREGDALRFTTQMLAYDAKRFHYVHCMYHADRAYLAATCEFMVLSVDLNVRRVSVVPSPLQKPHPPVFVASNASVEAVEYAGRKGFIPNYFSPIGVASGHNEAFMKAAAGAGRNYASGQMQSSVRWMQIGESEQDARRALAAHDADIWKNFYVPTLNTIAQSDKKFRTEGTPEDFVDDIIGSGLWFHGDIHQVKDQMTAEWQILPAEYITLIYHFAQMPKEAVIDNLDRFMREIKPDLDEITETVHAGNKLETATG